MDPYNFDEDVYVENRENVFSASFMEEMFGSDDSDGEFDGFTRGEIYMGTNSRVRAFHVRDGQAEEDQENEAPDVQREKKRKANPSQ